MRVCLRHHYLLNYQTDLLKTDILKNYGSALMANSFVLINSYSKTDVKQKSIKLRIDSAASSGGQGKLTSCISLGLCLRQDCQFQRFVYCVYNI